MRCRLLSMALLAICASTGCAESISPTVAAMPPSAEQSAATVGAYLREHEPDPLRRLRAAHDWVADRIAFDGAALELREIPFSEGDPETVFNRHAGVCEGYARLLADVGRAAGLSITVVHGLARTRDGSWSGHAWNEVWLGGRPREIDVTWDAGKVDEHGFFRKHYSTEYFLPTMNDFERDHRFDPDDAGGRPLDTLEGTSRW